MQANFIPKLNSLLLALTTSVAACSERPSAEKTTVASPHIITKTPTANAETNHSNSCSEENWKGWCKYSVPMHQIRKLWGSSDQDVWAVGAGGEGGGSILHWNGRAWNEVPLVIKKTLYAVWGFGPNDIWAGGEDGTIFHWNGTEWSMVPSGIKQTIFGIWGSSSTDVWAMSSKGNSVHWDGTKWTVGHIGTARDYFGGIWGSAHDDIWALAEQGVIAHWNGKVWKKVESGTDSDLNDVWGRNANDVWIAGDRGTILHWNGTAWAPKALDPSDNSARYKAIMGNGTDILMIGTGTDGQLDHILRFDGVSWQTINDRTGAVLETIWVGHNLATWVAGFNGKAWHLPQNAEK